MKDESNPRAQQTALQQLSSRRNWTSRFMIEGMIGGLRYLRKVWPGLDIQRAVWALQQIEIDIDERWYRARDIAQASAPLLDELDRANLRPGEFIEQRHYEDAR